jgi:predicted nucleotide-binding protein
MSEVSQSGLKTFQAKTREILNWWPSNLTERSNFKARTRRPFQERLAEGTGCLAPVTPSTATANAKIFVVHRHNRDARDQIELVLMRLGLQPFILQNADRGGRTIIEALDQNIYEETAFGIVLLTPDDYGYAKTETEADPEPRARQNVILEMGMVVAALGRSRMAILQKGV